MYQRSRATKKGTGHGRGSHTDDRRTAPGVLEGGDASQAETGPKKSSKWAKLGLGGALEPIWSRAAAAGSAAERSGAAWEPRADPAQKQRGAAPGDGSAWLERERELR